MLRLTLKQLEADGITPVYFRAAHEHEEVFRGVLRDVQLRTDLARSVDVEAPLDELLAVCYPSSAYGRFVVADFLVGPREGSPTMRWVSDMTPDESVIAYENVAAMSGGGEILKYTVAVDKTVAFDSAVMRMRS